MPLKKLPIDLKIAVFMSHYKRPEYTKIALDNLENAQEYKNTDFYIVDDNNPNYGLRDRIIDFFDNVRGKGYDLLCKVDNDCVVPKNWLNKVVDVFSKTDADILSPNVMPSNAAFTYGQDDTEGKGYRPSEIVGGLWCMKSECIDGLEFTKYGTNGLVGAISILKQIVTEKDLNIGWIPDLIVEDVGHWSGIHKDHIKSREHFEYSLEVSREVAWGING